MKSHGCNSAVVSARSESGYSPLETDENGLSKEEVSKRLQLHGHNDLPQTRPRSILRIFFHQFMDPLIYILIIAGILSIFVGDLQDALFIVVIIVIIAALGTWQESKAENSAATLRKLVKTSARVRRENKLYSIDAIDLVPGDIVFFEPGVKVPADCRIVHANNLTVEEALLTGESLAIEKTAEVLDEKVSSLGDQRNMLFAATTVMRGRGIAVVTATGRSTEIGRIASSLATAVPEKRPLIRRMEMLSKRISIAVVIVCALLGLVGWSHGMPVMEIFFFMVAVGISAIPEGLPVALTVALAIGTRRMAKRNVIIRRLPAAEGLGSCTLIASAKTGTLTLDQQSVQQLVMANNDRYRVSGSADTGDGAITPESTVYDRELLHHLIEVCVLANESVMSFENDEWVDSGDAVDRALLALSYKSAGSRAKVKAGIDIIKTIAYESENKFGAVFYKKGDALYFGMKGALEVILKHLSENDRQFAHEASEELAAAGYRVITIASGQVQQVWLEELPRLQLIGLLGLIGPLRAESIPAIQECQQAGMSVVMITGDHPLTAFKIARNSILLPINHR